MENRERDQKEEHFEELGRITQESVAEVHPPMKMRFHPVATPVEETSDPTDRHRQGHRRGDDVAEADFDVEPSFHKDDADRTADQTTHDRFRIEEFLEGRGFDQDRDLRADDAENQRRGDDLKRALVLTFIMTRIPPIVGDARGDRQDHEDRIGRYPVDSRQYAEVRRFPVEIKHALFS